MKHLYLLRHAHAGHGGPDTPDHLRSLSDRGKRECLALSRWITGTRFHVDAVICSTARRAIETLELLQAGSPSLPEPTYHQKLYLASPGELLAILHALDEGWERVLLIGHNPGFHELTLLLAQEGGEPLEALNDGLITAGLLGLEANIPSWAEMEPSCARLTCYRREAASA